MRNKTYCHVASGGNEVDVTNLFPKFQIRLEEAAKLALALLKKLGFRDVSLGLVFVSDAVIRHLNQKYLHHSWTTDVIAFSFFRSEDGKGSVRKPLPLGEVIISPKRAQVYSKRFYISFRQELVRYICHGIMHLKGYTDRSRQAQQLMRKKEDQLIKMFVRRHGIERII